MKLLKLLLPVITISLLAGLFACTDATSGGGGDVEPLDRILIDDSTLLPITNAHIRLMETGPGDITIVSANPDASGRFRLDFPSGYDSVDVLIDAEGYNSYSGDSWSEEDWNRESAKSIRMIPLNTGSGTYTTTVSGTVSDQATASGLSGVGISAADTDTGNVQATTSDTSGNYTLTITHDGDFTLTALISGYSSNTKTVTTANSAVTENISLTATGTGSSTTYTTTVSGRITDSNNGLGIPNVAVGATDTDTGSVQVASTDSSGNYSLTITHDGNFTLTGIAIGYAPLSTTINTTSSSYSSGSYQLTPNL